MVSFTHPVGYSLLKVDNATIDRFFTHCRAVCVAAVQAGFQKFIVINYSLN
jgi:hypothetical protein